MKEQPQREPLLTDVIGMFVGITIIAVAYGQQINAIQYLPGDNRGEPWFHPAIAVIGTVLGLFAFLVGSIRLLQGLRARRR